jgi:flagellar hook-basal body complex protein FliE
VNISPLIDHRRIEAMMAQLHAAARMPSDAMHGTNPMTVPVDPAALKGSQIGFAEAMKNTLDQVSATQKTAEQLSQRFSTGDDSVNLSDVMIATQKGSIALQAVVQVRNKLVSAYHDVLNMAV